MIPDAHQRLQAVLAPGHAFVWASAGTGKTHTLTLRALFLLLTAPFDPRASGTACARLYVAHQREERLAVAREISQRFVLTTFTRKAAAEMLTRLYEYLDSLASAPDWPALLSHISAMNRGHGDDQFRAVVEHVLPQAGSFDALRAGAAALAELANELQVCTLHSYAAGILRRHPIAAGIPPDAQFAEEDHAATELDPTAQLVDRWWRHVAADPELSERLAALLEHIPLADIEQWLVAIIQAPWIADELNFGPPDRQTLDELLAATDALVAGLAKARSNATNIHRANAALSAALQQVRAQKLGGWKTFCEALRTADSAVIRSRAKAAQDARAGLGRLKSYYETFEAAYVPALRQCLATDLAPLWQQWRAFLGKFARWANGAVVRELNLVTFNEMIRRAVALLAGHAEVRHEERTRLWALLVDEFQDTDPVQLELLRQLLGRHSATDHEVRGFFVGDHKQSIYRFRDADLPAITQFVRTYPALMGPNAAAIQEFRLTTSFRSRPAVIHFVNEFFQQHCPLPDYAREKLAPLREDTGPTPAWRALPPELATQNVTSRRQELARETARLIQEYVQHAPSPATAYNDLLVLVAKHDELDALLPVLEAAQIPVVSSGAKTFYQKPEVLDALNLLLVLHNPHDALALGALLRSPLFGLSDADLYRLRQNIGDRSLLTPGAPVPEWLPANVRQRLETLRRLAAARAECALADWLRQVRTFIPDGLYARQDREGRAVARIDAVFAAFRRLRERGTVPPVEWLLNQRNRVRTVDHYDAEMGEDISVTDESVAAVRAMTIHKAKGLQGRYVIVFGWQSVLDKQTPNKRHADRWLYLTRPDGQPLAGFKLPWGSLPIISPNYVAVTALNRQLAAEEANRLAYVAATRAEDRLVLLSDKLPPLADGHTTMTTQTITPIAPAAPAPPAPLPSIRDPHAYTKLWNQRVAILATTPPLLHRPSQAEPPEDEAREATDFLHAQFDAAREIGTLVHRYLERHLTDAAFAAQKLRAFTPREETAAAASAILKNFFGSSNHQRARRGRILGREMPVYFAENGKQWSGVIDLVFEEEGKICGIDYKTGQPPAPLPVAYEQQQRLYTTALQRLAPGQPVIFEFWWLTAEA